jgi:hypothetical protein
VAACGSHIIVVRFYPNEPGVTESGYGQTFGSEGDGRNFLSAHYAASAGANVEDEPEEAIPNGGIFAVPFEEEVNEFNRQSCDEWDATTMDTPPPEMNYPGF